MYKAKKIYLQIVFPECKLTIKKFFSFCFSGLSESTTLSALPPESITSLNDLGSNVITKNVHTFQDKKFRTVQSLFQHWLKFLSKHELLLTQYHSLPTFLKDYVSACYAESLIQGSTIKQQHISYPTVILYLKDAGIFKRPHPILPSRTLRYPPLLQSILHEFQRWQSIPNRRHPVTINMIDYLYKIQMHKHPDSYDCALYDWLVLGMHTGHRKSKWCQDTTAFRNSGSFFLSVQHTSTASIAQDFKLSYKPTPYESSSTTSQQPNYLEI